MSLSQGRQTFQLGKFQKVHRRGYRTKPLVHFHMFIFCPKLSIYLLILHISMNCVLQESQILLWGIKEFIRYHIIEQQVPPQGDISKFSISTMLKVKVKVNIIIQVEVECVGQHINRIFHHGRPYLLFPGLDLVHDVQLSKVWTANYLELMSGLIKS